MCFYFFQILEDRDMFQILGLSGACIGGAKLANFSITRGFLLYLALAPSKCFASRGGLAVLDFLGCFARKRGILLFTDERCI